MLRTWRGLSFLLVTLAAAPAAAQSAPPGPSDAKLIAALEEFIPHALRWDGAPGITIALGRGGKLIWQRGYGWADFAKKRAMTPDAITRAGSMSKPYTATAVMQLVEQGVLGLDQPVNRYLPDFKVTNPLGPRDITIRDLLTHSSGLSELDGRYADLGPVLSVHDYLAAVFARADDKGPDGKYLRWLGKVGEQAAYSNIGITLLGHVVALTNPEHLAYPDYVRRHIQQPLGMTVSHFPPDRDEGAQPAALTTGYAAVGGMLLPAPRLWTPVQPAGTLYATAAEHLRLVQAFLGGGSFGGVKILSSETVTQMLTPTMPFGDGKLGLVWMLANQGKPNASFHHAGAYMYGWTNMGAGFPRYDVGVVVAVNRWPMQTYGQNRVENAVTRFIGDWLAYEEANPSAERRPPHSWAWKRSYVIGLFMAHAYHSDLQAQVRLTPARLAAMGAGAVAQSGGTLASQWDAAGFRAGYDDMVPVAANPEALRTFLKSPALRVHPAELDLLFADIGGRGTIPTP